jgi:hypothetical protein
MNENVTNPTFEEWIEAHGFQPYVAMCASGNLGMNAPGICALREAHRRECLANLVPSWWWEDLLGGAVTLVSDSELEP